ncbi:hypothetical protein [Kaarinaea lacus]
MMQAFWSQAMKSQKSSTAVLVVVILSLLMTACETTGPTKEGEAKFPDDKKGVFIMYSEREEAGTPLFRSRMFINNHYLYIADDRFPNDFLLFDRDKQTIYSVTEANKTIFVIKPKEIKGKPPIEITYKEESQPSSAIPAVTGHKATHFRYFANGKHCYDAVTLEKKFLPEAVAALKEYRQVLAGEHASTVHKMPPETHEACDLALNIYYASKHLDTGIPLREWDQRGFLKFMVDYRLDFEFDDEKLKLPEGYSEFSVGG